MKRLRELRQSNGMSQAEFAKIFHASQNTISQWENGTRKPSYDIVQEIANFFQVSTDYLLGESEIPKNLDDQLDGIDFALFGEVKDLTDEQKQDVLDYIKYKKLKNKDSNR